MLETFKKRIKKLFSRRKTQKLTKKQKKKLNELKDKIILIRELTNNDKPKIIQVPYPANEAYLNNIKKNHNTNKKNKKKINLTKKINNKNTELYDNTYTSNILKSREIKEIELIGVEYKKGDINRDFRIMINRDKYKFSLFIFNDNLEHMLDYHKHKPNGLHSGSGNGFLRKYQNLRHIIFQKNEKMGPITTGIPTGSYKPQIASSKGKYLLKTKYHKNDIKIRIFNDIETDETYKLKTVKDYIDLSLEKIKILINKYPYDKIIYSADENGNIGSFSFDVHDENEN